MTPRTVLAIAVLAALVVTSYFLADRKPDGARPAVQDLPASYYLEDVVLRTTDGLGAVKYRLHAARADHDAADGSIALEKLRLEYGNGATRWRFEAERGHVPWDDSRISLSGDVRASTLGTSAESATAFASPTLVVDIDAERAATDDPVRFTFARGTLDGVGLDADFANEHVRLRSQVRGVFSPPPR